MKSSLQLAQVVAGASKMAFAAPKSPLLAVVGASGAGKSHLAVELARQFNGEIINGDAMQMYSGLPITTNKMPMQERKGVQHHLLGFMDPLETTWAVDKFVAAATAIIDDIHQRGRLPVLVGGTNYYTHSLLFREALVSTQSATVENPILDGTTEEMLEKLREVDPVMADRWHPHERRKIRRSLQIFLETQRPASEIYSEQAQEDVELNYPTMILCPHSESHVLKQRIRKRVDEMMGQGLLKEAIDLDYMIRQQDKSIARDEGLFVSIGFKEFESLLDALHSGEKDPGVLQRLEDEGVEYVKTHTWRYTRNQLQWIRNRLIPVFQRAVSDPSFVVVDTTDGMLDLSGAIQSTADFLQGKPVKLSAQARTNASKEILDRIATEPSAAGRHTCDICNATFVMESDWERHLRSRSHRRKSQRHLNPAQTLFNTSVSDSESNST